jgi:hypothetical protein
MLDVSMHSEWNWLYVQWLRRRRILPLHGTNATSHSATGDAGTDTSPDTDSSTNPSTDPRTDAITDPHAACDGIRVLVRSLDVAHAERSVGLIHRVRARRAFPDTRCGLDQGDLVRESCRQFRR